MAEPEYVSLKEAAARYGYDAEHFRRRAKRGELPGAFRVPPEDPKARWRVDLAELKKAWGK